MSEMRRYMEAAVEKLTPAKAQQMARSLVQGQGKEQVQKVAQDLMEWSSHQRERMTDMVRREVARQLKAMGVATKDDLDALKRRVRELERNGTSKAGAARATPAKAASATKATTAKPSASKPSTAKRSASDRASRGTRGSSGEAGS